MQIKSKKSANFFKFVLLYEAFIGGVSSAHGEIFCKKNVNIDRFYTIFRRKDWLCEHSECSTAQQNVPLAG